MTGPDRGANDVAGPLHQGRGSAQGSRIVRFFGIRRDRLRYGESRLSHSITRRRAENSGTPGFFLRLRCQSCVLRVSGLWVAAMCARSTGKSGASCSTERRTRISLPRLDKGQTALLFGDAGTATILEPDTDACPRLSSSRLTAPAGMRSLFPAEGTETG